MQACLLSNIKTSLIMIQTDTVTGSFSCPHNLGSPCKFLKECLSQRLSTVGCAVGKSVGILTNVGRPNSLGVETFPK